MRAIIIIIFFLTLPFVGVALIHNHRASGVSNPAFVPPGPSIVHPTPPPPSAPAGPTPTLQQLLDGLASRKPDNRERAAHALAALDPGPDDERVVRALAERLTDPEANVRWAVNGALVKLAPRAQAAIPALITVLKDRQHKEWASTVLANIGEPAVPALRRALDDHRVHVRRSATFALGAMGTDARAVAPDLRRLLRGERDPLVRRTAIWALNQVR